MIVRLEAAIRTSIASLFVGAVIGPAICLAEVPGAKVGKTLAYREEMLCAMDKAVASYLTDWPKHRWPHPHLKDPSAAMGAPAPAEVLHVIDGHLVFVIGRGDLKHLVVDGVEKPGYDDVLTPRLVEGGSRLIYRAIKKGEGYRLVIDDKDGPAYEHVGEPVFSANGRHMAYAAMKDKKWRVVIDGKETTAYGDIRDGQSPTMGYGGIVVSNDGRVAFSAYVDGKWKQIVDGEEGFESEGYGSFYGANDEHFSYVATKERKWFVVTDGVAGAPYAGIAPEYLRVVDDQIVYFANKEWKPPFEPQWFAVAAGREWALTGFPSHVLHATHFPLVIKEGNKARVMYQGREEGLYDAVKYPEASRDGKHVAYAARREGKWMAVIDGREGRAYDAIWVQRRWFTLAGDHCSYLARRDAQGVFVIDGKEQPVSPSIRDPMLSPDGSRFAYLVPDFPGNPTGPGSVAIDGKPGPRYDVAGLGIPSSWPGEYQVALFSPDSKRVAYLACAKVADGKSYEEVVVLDGSEGKRFPRVSGSTLAFTADGEHLCYNARTEKGWTRVVDGRETMFVPDAKDTVTFRQTPLTWYFVRDKSLFRATCR